MPEKFWITNKFHQTLPAQLPYEVKKSMRGTNKDLKNPKMLKQEWLFNPKYELWISLPDEYHSDFADRIKNRRWHFSPCLGISEHTANLKWLGEYKGVKLPQNEYEISSILPKNAVEINMDKIFEFGKNIALHHISMPCSVLGDRIFNHQNYYFERNGKAISVVTDRAISAGQSNIVFM